MTVALIEYQTSGLSFELGRKGTTLLGHQTPLYGEHSRPKWVSGISRPLQKEYSYCKEPIIEMTVRNGTQHPISRAYFKGTISSPGRSIPWLVEDFNYTIAGGLEPGEAQEWGLAPNMFSDWGKVNAPEDALFTVEVVRLDGPDGKALFDASGLTDNQLARLEKLKAQYQ